MKLFTCHIIEIYLYNNRFHENYEKNSEAFVRYHSETDSLNQSGILNLSNKNFDVALTCATWKQFTCIVITQFNIIQHSRLISLLQYQLPFILQTKNHKRCHRFRVVQKRNLFACHSIEIYLYNDTFHENSKPFVRNHSNDDTHD